MALRLRPAASGKKKSGGGARDTHHTPTAIMNKPLHPVTREADMEVPFLLEEMLS